MKMVEKLDSGPILSQLAIQINNDASYGELEKKLSKIGSKLLINCLNKIKSEKVSFIKQDHSKATYAKKINKPETKIQWDNDEKIILAKIKGLNPIPGAWFEYNKKRYKIFKAEIVDKKGKPGEVLNNDLVIGCKRKQLEF